jgi:hypothetical protein
MLTANRVVENIRIRTESSVDPIQVFWCQVLSSREDMRKRINNLKGDLDLVTIVLTRPGFDHPNAVLSDLNELIRDHKHEFQRGPAPKYRGSKPIILLLLSRTEFSLPQIASLITLPDWFPRLGGQHIFLTIEDLTGTADAPISGPEARIEEIAKRLFELEVALVKRMAAVASVNKHAGQELFQYLRAAPQQDYRQFLESAITYHEKLKNPEGFRPTVRENRCLSGRLIGLMRTATPDQISNRSKALAVALGVPEDVAVPRESFVSVLLRPTNKEDNPTHFARNLLISIYCAAQMITTAAHADEYSRYPVTLLRSISYDFRSVLETVRRSVESWL